MNNGNLVISCGMVTLAFILIDDFVGAILTGTRVFSGIKYSLKIWVAGGAFL
jgi:hypothetical protein